MSEHDTGDGLSVTGIYLKHTALAAEVHSLTEQMDGVLNRLQPFDQGNGSSFKTQVEVMRTEMSGITATLQRFEAMLKWFEERKGEIINVIRLKRMAGAIAAAILIAIGVDVWSNLTRHQMPVPAATLDVEALKRDLSQAVLDRLNDQNEATASKAQKPKYESVPAIRRKSKPHSRLFDPGQLRDATGVAPEGSIPVVRR